MIEELRTASETLRLALENYRDVCFALASHCEPVGIFSHISETILQEFQKAISYEKDISRCRGTIGRLCNRHRIIVSVNSLPPEILTRIFYLAHPHKCIMNYSSYPVEMPLRSQTNWALLQVCSYWRKVALTSHDLWTHVDLSIFTPNDEWMLGRARQFVSLSSEALLNVHAKVGGSIIWRNGQRTLDFCNLIAPRVKDISLFFASQIEPGRLPLYWALLGRCSPGRLTRLSIEVHEDHPVPLLMGAGNLSTPSEIRTLHQHIEQVLRQVTTLHLDGIFFHWSSQVYTGLMRLHLEHSGTSISASSLARVLRASPKLQFFRFGTSLAPETATNIDPIRLDQLLALRVDCGALADHERILSLLYPGTGPLYVNTNFDDEDIPGMSRLLTGGEHRRFFQRSNIVELYAKTWAYSQPIEMSELFQLMPNLRVLSLLGFDIIHNNESHLDVDPQLVELHLRGVNIEFGAIQYIMDTCPISQIIIDSECCWLKTYIEEEEGLDWDELAAEMWPVMKLVTDYSGPGMDGWD